MNKMIVSLDDSKSSKSEEYYYDLLGLTNVFIERF